VTKKNRYPLPLISETLDRLVGAKAFTKLDLKDAYHRLRIKEGDEWKTAFRTRYGHFEYMVMPFGLANAPSTFQAYINQAMQGLLDVVCVVYLDDILIYSHDESKHEEHVKMVLERLRENGLYVNLKKCQFKTRSVEFLGFNVSTDGISMEESRVATVNDWPRPKTAKELMTFLGFANFYRRFIARYSKIAAPLTNLLKGNGAAFQWRDVEQAAFDELKKAFTEAPLLRHFDPSLPSTLETDASGSAIACVISQPFPSETPAKGHRHPIAFWSRKLKDAEMNYEVHDAELLAIVEGFKRFRHYLEGSAHTVRVLTDHKNLKYFMHTKELNSRQARWAEKLARFDFEIEYRTGTSNPADPPSRRPDYEMSESEKTRVALPTLRNQLRRKDAGGPSAPDEDSGDEASEELVAVMPALVARLRWVLTGPAMDERSSRRQINARATQACVQESEADAGCVGGSRLPSTGEMPAVDNAIVDDGADAGQRLLEPPAGAGRCSDHVSRASIVAAIAGRTAYDLDEQSLLEVISDCQRKCTFAQQKKEQLVSTVNQSDAGSTKDWYVDTKGLLRKGGCLYTPTNSALREEILQRCHDDPLAGHFGVDKTSELVRRGYFWPKLTEHVQEYVQTCGICQRSKAKRHRPYGELASLPVPTKPWEEISMDFITDLPPSESGKAVYDAILVVVDRFTKMARYLPVRKDMDAEGLANVFLPHIVCRFGTPAGIVSDRGSLFTSEFWSSLCYQLKMKRKLSTAFHPQTDGQTERQNQVLEHYLRCYANHQQDDWVSLLPCAEFAYNATKHSSTGMSPFRALYGYEPSLDGNVVDDVPGGEVPTGARRAEEVIQLRKTLTENLRRAIDSQAKWYNKKHTPREFAKGAWVLLSTKNLKLARPCRKMSERYIGPFLITDIIGRQAYKLDLPPQVKTHPVFHVSVLEPYFPRDGEDPSTHDPPVVLPDGTEEWEIEKIVDDRTRYGKTEYRCRWKSWDAAYDTWQREEDLKNCREVLDEYLRDRRKKREPPGRTSEEPARKRGRPTRG
jgi:transposase InsO family protein